MASITRRVLLTSVSSLALAAATGMQAPLWGAKAAMQGRVCLGLTGITYYDCAYVFLNAWKQGAKIQFQANGKNYDSEILPGLANSAWDGFLDSDGELVRPLPENVTDLTRLFYAHPVDGPPEGFNPDGDEWVLKWDGKASGVTVSGALSMELSGNRLLWSWDGKADALWVTFSHIDRDDPPRNIRLCEARHEARLDAGEVFNPDWLEQVRKGSGILRFMDWQATNDNVGTLRFSDIPSVRYFSYGADTKTSSIKGGMPLELISHLSRETAKHPWVCIPAVLGTRKMTPIKSISNSKPAIVTAPGHEWQDGDQLIPYGTNWEQIERKTYTVSQADQSNGTFALSDLDSRGFEKYDSNWAHLTSPYDPDSVTPELTRFAAYFRDTIEPPFVTYFELGNELWNWIFNAPNWLTAIARGKFDDDDAYSMAGYLSAHCMKVIRDTYGPEQRSRWRGVLATQTVWPEVTERMIAGARRYLEDYALSLKITDLFDELGVTGYWGTIFNEERKDEIFEWMDRSEQLWRDGTEKTKYAFFNKIVNQECASSVNSLIPLWKAQKKIADQNGLNLIQYEGGNHNNPAFWDKLSDAELKRFMIFYKKSNHTIEDAVNYTTMFENFIASGGQFPAKFVELSPVSRYGAWGGLRHMKDKNPVWDAVVAFNSKA